MKLRVDGEALITCSHCGEQAIHREITVVSSSGKTARRVPYETHCESVIDEQHIAAQTRLLNFYRSVFDLIEQFEALPADWKVITTASGNAVLLELVLGSERPSACEVRTVIIPSFEAKAFGREFDINLPPRTMVGTTTQTLLDEAKTAATSQIDELSDRARRGLL